MSKVRKFAEITPNLPFSEFNFYELYRETFEHSELGRMKKILPLHKMAESFGLVRKSMTPKHGRKSYFTPEGKVALMFLKMKTQMSFPKLMEELNGNIHYQMFCDILIDPTHPLTNYKLLDDIAAELAGSLKIQELQNLLAEAWKPYMKNLDTMFTDATCYESEMRYPTDQKLLWECVEKGYDLMCEASQKLGIHRPRTKYLDVEKANLTYRKQRKHTKGQTRKITRRLLDLLGKMASDFEKPDKVHTLWENEVQEKMWQLPVRELLWVGKKTEERLTAYGIRTIGDLAKLGIGSLTRLVGAKFAQQLHENANGRDDSPAETEVAEAKSYSAERTFSKDLVDPKDIDRALFNVACIVAHRIRRDDFRASCMSMFVKSKDFTVAQKQTSLAQPTDMTAVILNEARRMLGDVWDGATPLRQVGLGVSKLTHESAVQMSMFEDPKMEYYREWDKQYDEERSRAEDARMLAYERKVTTQEPPAERLSDVPIPQRPRPRPAAPKDDALVFTYPNGEVALSAAKKAIKGHPTYRFQRHQIDDGTDCFEVLDGSKVIERHTVAK